MNYTIFDSPIGPLTLTGDGASLQSVCFGAQPPSGLPRADEAFSAVVRQLQEYFSGERREFDIVLAPAGTPFQLAVWNALRTIPYGETRSYGEVAKLVGRPAAVRAVGAANGANPLPIVVPCHRVIGSNGSLTGFGGGLDLKRRLLELERGIRRLI